MRRNYPRSITRGDFAGPGGWSEGLRLLGIREDFAIEWDPTSKAEVQPAVATARAAGHSRWQVDVTSPGCRLSSWGQFLMRLYTASPPCQPFAQSGKGDGRRHLDSLRLAAGLVGIGMTPEEAIADTSDTALDKRSVLALEPLYVIANHHPVNVALEQVPPVLPIWEAYAEILREWGYSVWTGYVHSEQYGVPQTRKRAILMASLERKITGPPTPTHSRYHARTPDRLDDGVKPWVSMEEALGRPPIAAVPGDTSWTSRRPSPTIIGSYAPDVVAAPGYRKAGDGPRQSQPGSVRVTVQEAGILQSFPADYPWQGTKGQQFQQVGNAVPPLMASAIVAHVLGIELP